MRENPVVERSTAEQRGFPLEAALKLALLVLVVAGLAFLTSRMPVGDQIAWLTREVETLGVWGPVAFGTAFVLFTVVLLPATPLVLATGAVFGVIWGTVVISIASTVSAALSFLASRYVAHDRVAGGIRRYPKLDAVYRALGGPEGWKIVAAVRLSHAMPYGIQNLLFGASPVRFLPFLASTWVAMLPGTLLYVYLGDFGAQAVQEGAGVEPAAGPVGWGVRVAGLAVAALAVFYVTRLGRRIILQKAHVDITSHPLASPPQEG